MKTFTAALLISNLVFASSANSAVVLNSFSAFYENGAVFLLMFDDTRYMDDEDINIICEITITPSTPCNLTSLIATDSGGSHPDLTGGSVTFEAKVIGTNVDLNNWWAQSGTGAGVVYSYNGAYFAVGIPGFDARFSPLTSSRLFYEYFPPAEVPIPAAAWLLGSAFLGLAGIKHSRNRVRRPEMPGH